MRTSGIYKILSLCKPERVYIGSAINIDQRWRLHLSCLRLGTHHNKKLQGHFNKYGESDLQFSVILECPKEQLITREQDFLDALSPWFNICKTANSWLGNTHSEKTKKKQSIARTGVPGYYTGKIGPNKDRSFSVETKAAMSKSKIGNKNALGYIHSDKTREKLRLAWEKRKLNNQGNG